MVYDIEHFKNTICISSLSRCLFISLPIFSGVVCVRGLCIFETNPLLDMCFQIFFSQLLACLLIF